MGIIRLLLAANVLLWHAPPSFLPHFLFPSLSVQCFYCISGFLIQAVIRGKYQGGAGWQWDFYKSRILRIYPLYLLFAVVSVAVVGTGSFSYYLRHDLWAAAAWLFNVAFILGQDVLRFFYYDVDLGQFLTKPVGVGGRFLAEHHAIGSLTVMGQSWTLAIELYFYLLAPLLLTRRLRFVATLIALSLAVRLGLGYAGFIGRQWLYGFFPSEIGLFLLGAMSYRAYAYFFVAGRLERALRHMPRLDTARPLTIASLLAVAGLCAAYLFTNLGTFGGDWKAPLGAPNAYWLLLALTLPALPFAFHFSRRFPWDRRIGDLSYPVYISHWVVLRLVEKTPWAQQHSTWVGPAMLLFCIALSVVLLRLIEDPIDRFRHRHFGRSAAPAAALAQPAAAPAA
jgi:peptidoglycan/LPS O-acetylase OafA/YrhL